MFVFLFLKNLNLFIFLFQINIFFIFFVLFCYDDRSKESNPRLLGLARPLDLVALGLTLPPDPIHLKSRFIIFFTFKIKFFIDLLKSTNQYASIIYVNCMATTSLHLGHDHTTTYLFGLIQYFGISIFFLKYIILKFFELINYIFTILLYYLWTYRIDRVILVKLLFFYI